MKPRISIAIPAHDMANKAFFLRRSLDAMAQQTFNDFEIVVTDNSEDDVLFDVLKENYRFWNFRYLKNPIKGMAQNTNCAIKESWGEIIKVLYLDDFLAHRNSLLDIHKSFDENTQWLVTACDHDIGNNMRTNIHYASFFPEDEDNMIGSPSVLAIRNNEDKIYFDESMTWLLDFDYYKRLHAKYGFPTYLHSPNVVIGIHQGQATHLLSDELKLKERVYVNTKHAK